MEAVKEHGIAFVEGGSDNRALRVELGTAPATRPARVVGVFRIGGLMTDTAMALPNSRVSCQRGALAS